MQNLYQYYTQNGGQYAAYGSSQRTADAQRAGIQNYAGSADQNTQLLNYLQNNKAGSSSSGNSTINNTTVNNTPDAYSLFRTQPVTIPSPSNGTSTSANAAIGASQGALLGLQNQNVQDAQANYQKSADSTQGLINQYLGKGQEQINMENAAGAPQMQALSNSLNNQYYTQGAAYNAQYNDIYNRVGGTAATKTQEISALQQQHGYDLTNTAIQASIASTNYSNAETIINHQIDLKYAPIKDSIDFGIQFMAQNKDLLTTAQTQQFSAQLQVQQQTYDQGVYNDHLIKDTQTQMIKDAAAQGASADILNNMGQIMTNGGTIGDVATASGGYLQQGSYQPVQTGYDPNTGLPIYSGFNAKTGQMEVKNSGGTLGTTGNSQTTVTGADGTSYQMGASTTMGAYSSATQTQVNSISAATAKIQATVGTITDPASAQHAINAVAPNSPITGAMVMASAQKYGVDPATLIGVMQAETQLGTDGSKGSQLFNWGNVGNTDIKMKLGQPVSMKNAQAGVDAVAQNLAQRKVQAGQTDPAQPVQNQDLTPQQIAAQSIKNAPAFLQPAMGTSVATGAVYIDSSKVSGTLDVVAKAYSAKTGIPILNSDQVAIVNGADEAIRNITDVIAPAWSEIGQKDQFANNRSITNYWASRLFDTQFYQKTNTFNANQESLAGQIRALSQSAPKGSLLSTAEAALPNAIGSGGTADTLADGNAKMQRTLDLLNQTIKTFLPNAMPAMLPSSAPATTGTLNGLTWILGSDGNYHSQ